MVDLSRRQVLWSLAAGVGAAAASGGSINAPGVANADSALSVSVLDHGVKGDGVTDDRDSIQGAINTVGGSRPLVFPPGRYRIGSSGTSGPNRITMPAGTHLVFEDGAVVEVNAVDRQSGTAIFYAAGTDGPKMKLKVEANSGEPLVELPPEATGKFQIGDIVGLESQGVAGDYTGGGSWYVREFHEIVRIDAGFLHLDSPLEYSYLPNESAVLWKIDTVDNIIVEGAVFESGPDVTAGVDGTYPIRLSKVRDFTLARLQIRNMIGGIAVHDAYRGSIDNCSANGLPRYKDSYGYGVHIAGASAKIDINNLFGSDTRHLFTTLADQRGETFWGGPMYIRINKGIGHGSPSGYSVWDTHEFGRHIEFNNCVALGGGVNVSGFQMRAQDVSLNNCCAMDNGFRGVHLHHRSKRIAIRGGDFGSAGHQGLAIAGADHQVVGAYVHDCGGSGIAIVNSEGLQVRGCVIINNGTGLEDGGAEASPSAAIRASKDARITDCIVPFSSKQKISIASLSISAVAENLLCLGYPSMGGMRDAAAGAWGAPNGATYSMMTSDGWIASTQVPNEPEGG